MLEFLIWSAVDLTHGREDEMKIPIRVAPRSLFCLESVKISSELPLSKYFHLIYHRDMLKESYISSGLILLHCANLHENWNLIPD